jgi:hypothetical protein
MIENTLPFSTKLGENLNDLNDRVLKKKASLMLIDGGVGEGKTTLAVHTGDYVNSLHGLGPISLEFNNHPQIALGGEDFLKKLRECYEKKLPCIIYDEAGDFNRRGSLTRFNQTLNRTFETFRGFRILVILCLPSFNVLDVDIFQKGIPRLLLHLHSRSEKQGNFAGFSLYRMHYVREKMTKLVVKPFAYDIVEPNFRGHFKDLPPSRSAWLDNISTKGKIKELENNEIKISGLMGYNELARKIGRSLIWTRVAISKLKIKHERLIKRQKFFREETLDRLMDYLDTVNDQRKSKK